MKINIARAELVAAISSVIGASEKRSTALTLNNILFHASEGACAVTCTDLEIQVTAIARANVLTAGDASIPARKLFDIVRGLPEGADIAIEMKGEKATIRSGRSRFSLACMDPKQFPAMTTNAGASFSVKQGHLRSLIDCTLYAVAQNDPRIPLNGMLIEVTKDKLTSVATDGHRMSALTVEGPTGLSGDDVNAILPRKVAQELLKALSDLDAMAKVVIGTGQVTVELDCVTVTSRLIEGRFPDHTAVIPKAFKSVITGKVSDFQQAIGRAKVLVSPNSNAVTVVASAKRLQLLCTNESGEDGTEELEIGNVEGEVTTAFNVHYLSEAVRSIGGETFTMRVSSETAPVLFLSEGIPGLRALVMPCRA